MKSDKRSLIVIINCLVIHSLVALDVPSYIINCNDQLSRVITGNVSVGLSLLLFPVFGLMADVCFTRYQMIQLSLIMLVACGIFVLVLEFMNITEFLQYYIPIGMWLAAIAISVLTFIASTGLFDANGIQFGIDQLLEASSRQLSTFIHWYFWSMHFGQEAVFCIVLVITIAIPTTPFLLYGKREESLLTATLAGILLIAWVAGVLFLYSLL